jgi:hypothetical protein
MGTASILKSMTNISSRRYLGLGLPPHRPRPLCTVKWLGPSDLYLADLAKHGKNTVQNTVRPADWGLDSDALREQFSFYHERYRDLIRPRA